MRPYPNEEFPPKKKLMHMTFLLKLLLLCKLQLFLCSLTPMRQKKKNLLYSQICLAWFNVCLLYSKLPYDVTTEQALTHTEVVSKLESSIQSLRAVTDKVLTSIFSSLNMMP